MNLVAKEVPVVSDSGCALVLSREAGACEELGEDALVVEPVRRGQDGGRLARGALVLARPGSRPSGRSGSRATHHRAAPARWFLEQLDALRGRGAGWGLLVLDRRAGAGLLADRGSISAFDRGDRGAMRFPLVRRIAPVLLRPLRRTGSPAGTGPAGGAGLLADRVDLRVRPEGHRRQFTWSVHFVRPRRPGRGSTPSGVSRDVPPVVVPSSAVGDCAVLGAVAVGARRGVVGAAAFAAAAAGGEASGRGSRGEDEQQGLPSGHDGFLYGFGLTEPGVTPCEAGRARPEFHRPGRRTRLLTRGEPSVTLSQASRCARAASSATTPAGPATSTSARAQLRHLVAAAADQEARGALGAEGVDGRVGPGGRRGRLRRRGRRRRRGVRVRPQGRALVHARRAQLPGPCGPARRSGRAGRPGR